MFRVTFLGLLVSLHSTYGGNIYLGREYSWPNGFTDEAVQRYAKVTFVKSSSGQGHYPPVPRPFGNTSVRLAKLGAWVLLVHLTSRTVGPTAGEPGHNDGTIPDEIDGKRPSF